MKQYAMECFISHEDAELIVQVAEAKACTNQGNDLGMATHVIRTILDHWHDFSGLRELDAWGEGPFVMFGEYAINYKPVWRFGQGWIYEQR